EAVVVERQGRFVGRFLRRYTQWAMLRELPPHLLTAIPIASVHPGVDFPYPEVAGAYALRWLLFLGGTALNRKQFLDAGQWGAKEKQLFVEHVPFREYGKLLGEPKVAATFRDWLDHRRDLARWQALTPTREQMKKIALPILTITGWYDDDQVGA